GYLYEKDGESSLIVRNFRVNPSGEYVDVPWTEPENFGFSFQACNVNSHLGAFSELEYHAPALNPRENAAVSEDESQLWAFRGDRGTILSIARHLLGSEV